MTDPMSAWLAAHQRDHLRRPRWLHRVWARVFGYFWAPCPECGRMFGGQEAARGVSRLDPSQLDHGFLVCRGCGPIVAKRQSGRRPR